MFPYRLPPLENGEAGVALFIHCSQELPQGLHDQSRAIHFKGASWTNKSDVQGLQCRKSHN